MEPKYYRKAIVKADTNQIKQCGVNDIIKTGDQIRIDVVYNDGWDECHKNVWKELGDGVFEVKRIDIIVPKYIYKEVEPKSIKDLLDDF